MKDQEQEQEQDSDQIPNRASSEHEGWRILHCAPTSVTLIDERLRMIADQDQKFLIKVEERQKSLRIYFCLLFSHSSQHIQS